MVNGKIVVGFLRVLMFPRILILKALCWESV